MQRGLPWFQHEPSFRLGRFAEFGFTIIELLIVVALIGLLAGLGSSNYLRNIERARIVRTISEISSFGMAVQASRHGETSELPRSLDDAGLTTPNDPWGNPYHYLKIEGVFDVTYHLTPESALPAVAAGDGDTRPPPDKPRKDRFFKPISTDFDLYSSGPDGISRESLEHRESRDDIVRALNGGYVGAADRF